MAQIADPRDLPPAWMTAIGTGVAYLLLLTVMFVLLFVVPYLVFTFV